MKIAALAAVVMAAAGASAAELKNAVEIVSICSDNTADLISVLRARNIATQMFAAIEVGIEWHDAPSCPTGALRVSFSTSTPGNLLPGALAYALPYEGTHIVIFYDRVQAAAVDPRRVPAVLGHVLVHEITHVLEGVARHSAEGVMKAHWTNEDYSRMCWKPLPFADEDVALIHRGLEWRAARRNVAQPGTTVLAGVE
jgi:hypothetical protein